jgi:hypothetical protein
MSSLNTVSVVDTEYGGPSSTVIDTRNINPGEPVLIRGTWLDEQATVLKDGEQIGTVGPSNPRLKDVVDTPAGENVTFRFEQSDGNSRTITKAVRPWPDDVDVPSGVPDSLLTSDPAENVHDEQPDPADEPGLVNADNESGAALAPALRRRLGNISGETSSGVEFDAVSDPEEMLPSNDGGDGPSIGLVAVVVGVVAVLAGVFA